MDGDRKERNRVVLNERIRWNGMELNKMGGDGIMCSGEERRREVKRRKEWRGVKWSGVERNEIEYNRIEFYF